MSDIETFYIWTMLIALLGVAFGIVYTIGYNIGYTKAIDYYSDEINKTLDEG